MLTQLLHIIFYCTLTTVFASECASATTQKKPFTSCAKQKQPAIPTSVPLKLADNRQTQPNTKTAASSRSITVTSKITNEMLGYKKFGKHYPDKEFNIFINGKELVNRQEIRENKTKTMTATIKDNILPIEFRYEFNHIWRNKGKGTRRVAFKIPPTANTIELTFNWKTDSQVLIKNVSGATFAKDLSDTKQ